MTSSTTFDDICRVVREHRGLEIKLGAFLKYARTHYKDLVGDGVDTWYEFLKQPEIGITAKEASYLIDLYSYVELGDGESDFDEVVAVPKPSMKLLLRGMGDLAAAQTLTTKDFKEKYYDDKTDYKGKRTYTFLLMKRCNETGNISKVHGVENDAIVDRFKDEIENGLE